MSEEVLCNEKHTAFQPDDKEWFCPKCGVDSSGKLKNGKYPNDTTFSQGEFCVEDSPNYECPKIHPDDNINCGHCESGWTGAQYARLMMKKKDVVPCPCCKGAGIVDSKKAAKFTKK